MTRAHAPKSARPLLVVAVLAVAALAASCSTGGSRDQGTDGSAQTGSSTTLPGEEPGSEPSGSSGDRFRIEVLSSAPDRVSGDDARIRVVPPAGATVGDLKVTRGDVDITSELTPRGGGLEGVVDGLVEGNNTLRATAGNDDAVTRIRAWPITGPIISGPHLPLLACSTATHGLGAPQGSNCSAPTSVTWKYVDQRGALRPLPGGRGQPADLGTATVDGEDVPFYVRVERGVINRSIYQIASLDPTPADDDPTGAGWNRALLYRYGGGCGTTYGQGTSQVSAEAPAYLRQGYVVATATFNDFGVQCNDVLSAETTMMVKERVIEQFGVPDLTIGEGASGGAAQLHLQAQNYPGLVDGIVASRPFPDTLTVASGATDCGLLQAYYRSTPGSALSEAQRVAINGHASATTCSSWERSFRDLLDPTLGCDPAIGADQIYDPDSNRAGVRCTLQDASANQHLRAPGTGWAQRPLDNVGVQYGLEALNEGAITVEEFLSLNTAIGGYDLDGAIVTDRHEAEPEAVLHAYETGRIAMGGGDLSAIPIIDINVDTEGTGDIHDRLRAFSLRDRLAPASEPDAAPGFQIWTRPAGTEDLDRLLASAGTGGPEAVDAVEVVRQWVMAIQAAESGGEPGEVLRRTRPKAAVDNCLPPGTDTPLGGVGIYDQPGPCRDDHPISGDPRTAAGAPRSNQILKCALKPVDPDDYEVALSASHLDRLDAIFPQGVCDWDVPSVGEAVPVTPDRSYQDVETPAQSA